MQYLLPALLRAYTFFEDYRLPFGIATTPALFLRTLVSMLTSIPGISVHLDDKIVSCARPGQYLARLEQVLCQLETTGLCFHKGKCPCPFALSEVVFLGGKITAANVHSTLEEVQAITDVPESTDKTSLQAFLGQLAFYDRFLQGQAMAVADLCPLLSKHTMRMEKEAFEGTPRPRQTHQRCHSSDAL